MRWRKDIEKEGIREDTYMSSKRKVEKIIMKGKINNKELWNKNFKIIQ